MIKLFDLENGIVKPTEHCYVIKWLKDIMDIYPDNYMKIYAYIFYMTCPNAELNAFFNIREGDKEEMIYDYIDGDFSLEDPIIHVAVENSKKMNQTASYRAFLGVKVFLDNLSDLLQSPITTGRDGNGPFLKDAAKELPKIKDAYDKAFEDLNKEQKVRGGKDMAYDQRGHKIKPDELYSEE